MTDVAPSSAASASQPEAPPPAGRAHPAARSPAPRPLLRETCGALRDYWYVACTAEELDQRRPLGRVVLEEALVLYRDSRGQAVCFRDRCLHRNAMLSEGYLEGDCLRCPYHGWAYDPEGRCVEIPSEGPETFVAPKKRLAAFPTCERYGLVWVWMGDPEQVDKEPFPMPHWGEQEQGWEAYYMVTMFDNDVTNCAENFMDVPHTVYVHRGWFRSQARQRIRARVERTPDSVLVTYDQPNDSIGFSGRILNPSGEPMVHTDKFYMPNVTRVDYDFGSRRSFVITSQCTPETASRTRVYTLISFRLGGRLLNRLGRALLPPYTRKVIQQDVEIMENQGQSLERYGAEFLNSQADLLHRYIESLRDHAARGGEGPGPEPTVGEIVFFV